MKVIPQPCQQFAAYSRPLYGFIHRKVRQVATIREVSQCARYPYYFAINSRRKDQIGMSKHSPQPLLIFYWSPLAKSGRHQRLAEFLHS